MSSSQHGSTRTCTCTCTRRKPREPDLWGNHTKAGEAYPPREDLRREMSEVSEYFQLIARTHWSNLFYFPFPVNGIIDVDVDHMTLREDERDMLQRFVNGILGSISVQYQINYVAQLRSHRDPSYIYLIHLFDVHFLRRQYVQDRLERVNVSLRFIFNRFNQEV